MGLRLWQLSGTITTKVYPKDSGLSHNEMTTTTTTNIRWEATQRVMAAKLTRLTHKIAIQLHLEVQSCAICSSLSRRPVRILLDTPSSIMGCPAFRLPPYPYFLVRFILYILFLFIWV